MAVPTFRLLALSLTLAAGLLSACAAPTPEPQTAQLAARDEEAPAAAAPAVSPAPRRSADAAPAAEPRPAPRPAPRRAPPMSDPLPPQIVEDAPARGGSKVTVDRSCRTDADCTVKNVGNCCGYFPACVNVNSPTDPEGVQAQCAKDGMASVCGFQEIRGCQCVQGQCKADGAADLIR